MSRVDDLIPADLQETMRANARRARSDDAFDPEPVIKLFTSGHPATWLLTELEGETAYGLCDLGTGLPEVGRVDLGALTEIERTMGSRLERDLFFIAKGPLSEYETDAKSAGRVIFT